jgi:hypothetical protein
LPGLFYNCRTQMGFSGVAIDGDPFE